jgi:hypothetical protein
MALGTISIIHRKMDGDRNHVAGTIRCTSGANYTPGGEPITPAMLGFADIIEVLDAQLLNAAASRLVAWDQANQKLKVFTALGTEAVAGTDQSTIVVGFEAEGY